MGATRNTGYLENIIAYDSSNNVGISTTVDATYKVVLGGNTKINGTSLVTGAATFSGTINANSTNSQIRIGGATTDAFIGVSTSTLYLTDWATAAKGLTINLSTGAATFSSSVTATSGLFNGYTSGLPPTSGSATRGGLRLNNASNIAFDFGTVAAGQAWIQISDANNYASNFALLLNPNGGNVGIGTSSPAGYGTTLQIAGSSVSDASFVLGDGTGTTTNRYLAARPGSSGNFRFGTDSGDILFCTGLNPGTGIGTERMRISSGGSILVGTTTAYSYRMMVEGISGNLFWLTNGSANSQIFLSSGNNFYITNGNSQGVVLNSGATSWSSYSDERLKNINSTITNALDKLLLLRAINFNWKSDTTKKENLGLIAQDIEKVFPQLIDKSEKPNSDDKTEYLSVRYTEMIPVLVKAIQEQQTQIEELKALINK